MKTQLTSLKLVMLGSKRSLIYDFLSNMFINLQPKNQYTHSLNSAYRSVNIQTQSYIKNK
ncbi:hypothetical protein Hanom_Chr12g01131871 [Helianthus anomalus]